MEIEAIAKILMPLVIKALDEVAKNKIAINYVQNRAQKSDDWIQEKRGLTNHRSLEDNMTLAIKSAQVQNTEQTIDILTTITLLHSEDSSPRGAVIGGTLLKRMGSGVFPDIAERELRFAQDFDPKSYAHTREFISNNIEDYLKQISDAFDPNEALASNKYSTIGAVSAVHVQGLAGLGMKYGPKLLQALVKLLGL